MADGLRPHVSPFHPHTCLAPPGSFLLRYTRLTCAVFSFVSLRQMNVKQTTCGHGWDQKPGPLLGPGTRTQHTHAARLDFHET